MPEKNLKMNKKIILISILPIIIICGIVFAFQRNSYQKTGDKDLLKEFSSDGIRNAVEDSEFFEDSESDENQKRTIAQKIDFIAKIGKQFFGIEKKIFFESINKMVELKNLKASKIINVPEDYLVIQEAIDTANFGDTIKVASGEYQENIIMKEGVSLIGTGKINLIPPSSLVSECFTKEMIETMSEEELADFFQENIGITSCNEQDNSTEEVITQNENLTDEQLPSEENFDVIINGNGVGNVITFKNGITNKTTLSGFIIKNSGKSLSGILIEDSSPWIHDNILIDNEFNIYIKGNSAPVIQKNALQFASKGIQVYNFQKEYLLIENEDINNESSNPEEPTIPIFLTKPNIIDNLITDNKIGIDLYNSSALINHNTISYNNHYKTYLGATFGIYTINSSAEITNNIISDNGICELCAGINIDAKSKDISISYNNIWNNKNNFVCYGQCEMQDNNLSENPQFANSIDGNYFLQKDSSLIGKAENELNIGVRW